jgi:eukaryotic-like serine/threonine-protein kinase
MDRVAPLIAHPAEIASRFVLRRCLGQGGFGVVHEAEDRMQGRSVALKELLTLDPASLYAFKQEFRSLADVVHDNLVELQELFSVDGRWYLTMELVRGENFLRHVRPLPAGATGPTLPGPRDPTAHDDTTFVSELSIVPTVVFHSQLTQVVAPEVRSTTQSSGGGPRTAHRAQPDSTGALDVDRLRLALRQLTFGVEAIHRAGRLHRDLKPSNVLVTEAGRVVILDFGLIGVLGSHAKGGAIVGTPAYMAPEQTAYGTVSQAADWYSIGIMLYEALTGFVPHLFEGTTVAELVLTKRAVDPPQPRAILPGLPEDLNELCMRLLDRDPRSRAGAAEIRRVLGESTVPPLPTSGPTAGAPVFIGRAEELSVLQTAYRHIRAEGPMVVHLHGTSGMGKSDLVRRFLDTLPAADAPLVLEGRCHEREWVPYKAFDSAVDALARFLAPMDPDEASRLIPRGIHALVRLFPVLGSLEVLGEMLGAPSEHPSPDPHEMRRRAFSAFRQLLRKLGEAHALVLYLDDLQWADADSATLLDALLGPPDPPRILLLASYRTEEGKTGAFVQSLPSPSSPSPHISSREIVVGPLSPADAEALSRSILGEGMDPAEAARKATQIAREAGYSPFFVQELSRHAAKGLSGDGIGWSEVVGARVEALPAGARALLEIVSAAGRPLDPVVLRKAAGLDEEEERSALAMLRAGGLLRMKGDGSSVRVETYHDRIREAVVQRLSPDSLRGRHRSLASAMETMSDADPEALAMHFRMAGEPRRAREHMERAAQRAARALAFDRAAILYRHAVDLTDLTDPAELGELELKLADALAKAGRGAEAADVFLQAARRVGPEASVLARRRAAEHRLRAGHIREGLNVVSALLPDLGMRLAPTPKHALASMLWSRAKLRIRGASFKERSEAQIDPRELHRIDLCWAIGNGLGGTDLIRGADFQARHLLLALKSGEPYRIARALAWEAVLRSTEGSAGALEKAEELATRAHAIAHRIQHPHAIAWASAGKALTVQNGLRFREAAVLCEQTIALFREACTDIAWEVGSMYAWWLFQALYFLGELPRMNEILPRAEGEADLLGDLYTQTALRTSAKPISLLLADKPSEALVCAEGALRRWSKDGYHTMHWTGLLSRVNAHLYLGDGRRALELVRAEWGALEGSFLLRSKFARTRALDLKSRVLLARAREVPSPEPLLREVAEAGDKLAKEDTPLADGLVHAVRGALRLWRGDPLGAAELYTRARASFLKREMHFFAYAAGRHAADLQQDRARLAEIDAWMKAHDVKDPERAAAALMPR